MENNKNYTTQLDGYKQIIKLLTDYTESLNKVSRFQIATEQLSSNHKKLMDLQPLLSKDITSSEKVTSKRRGELIDKIMPVIRIMQVFAFDKRKKKLQKRLDYLTSEYIDNCSDNKLVKISKKIGLIAIKYGEYPTSFASKIKTSLNPDKAKANIKFKTEYGLKPEMIKNIEDSNIRFIESMLLYHGELNEKEKVAMKMKKINKQTKNLLSNKIDRFALLFEKENPNFFLEYRVLRDKQIPTEALDASNHKADPQNLVKVEEKVRPAESKLKARTHQNSTPEKK